VCSLSRRATAFAHLILGSTLTALVVKTLCGKIYWFQGGLPL
jgi:hypothetical protein